MPTGHPKRGRQAPAEDTAAFGGIAERFRRAGDLDRAIALCREGLQKFPDHLSARVTLGWALIDQGKYDDAQAELEQVLKRAPDNLAAIRGLAELHERAENAVELSLDGPGAWPPDAKTIEEASVEATAATVAEPAPAEVPPDVAPPAIETPAAETTTSGWDTNLPNISAEVGGFAKLEVEPSHEAPAPSAPASAELEPIAPALDTVDPSAEALLRELEELEAGAAAAPAPLAGGIAAKRHASVVADPVIEDAASRLPEDLPSLGDPATELEVEPVSLDEALTEVAPPQVAGTAPEVEEPLVEAAAVEAAVVEPAVVEPPAEAPIPEVPAVPEPVAAAVAAPAPTAEPEPVATVEPEPVAVVEPAAMVEPEPVALIAPEPVAQPEPIAEPEPEPEPVAAAPAARPSRGQATIVTLERMLRRVDTRRAELASKLNRAS